MIFVLWYKVYFIKYERFLDTLTLNHLSVLIVSVDYKNLLIFRCCKCNAMHYLTTWISCKVCYFQSLFSVTYFCFCQSFPFSLTHFCLPVCLSLFCPPTPSQPQGEERMDMTYRPSAAQGPRLSIPPFSFSPWTSAAQAPSSLDPSQPQAPWPPRSHSSG